MSRPASETPASEELPSVSGSALLRTGVTRNRRWLLVGSGLWGSYEIGEALVPIVIGVVIDRAISTGDGLSLARWLVVLAVVFVGLSLSWRYGARWLTYAEAGEGATLRIETADAILQPRVIDTEHQSGELLSISSSDADNASYFLDYIPRAVEAFAAAAACAVALLVIDLPLGLCIVLGTPIIVGVLHLGSPVVTRRVEHQQERAGEATAVATDLVAGIRPLQGIAAELTATDRYRRVSQDSLDATLAAARSQQLLEGISIGFSSLLAAGVAILAGLRALDGALSIGQLVAVVGLAQFLVGPLTQMTSIPSWFAEARASANRVASVLAAPPLLPAHAGAVSESSPRLVIDGLHHRTLDGLSLAVEPGEHVGIVTLRSSDGEALVDVLASAVAPDAWSGEVRVGGQSLLDLPTDHARSILLVEPHHIDLFSGTIASNLELGRTNADHLTDPGGVERVLRASAVLDVVADHPDGLGAEVSERGASLSGGQRQRLALARALLSRPPILVLRNPTTSIDSVTEQAVADGIRSERHDGTADFTTIAITTSPALLASADRVIVVGDEGRVIAEGTHAELLDRVDGYRDAVLR